MSTPAVMRCAILVENPTQPRAWFLYCASMERRSLSRSSRPLPSITSCAGVGGGAGVGRPRQGGRPGACAVARGCWPGLPPAVTGAAAPAAPRASRRPQPPPPTPGLPSTAAAAAHLRALAHDPARRVPDEVDALLVVQPPDEAKHRDVGVLGQPQLPLQRELALALALDQVVGAVLRVAVAGEVDVLHGGPLTAGGGGVGVRGGGGRGVGVGVVVGVGVGV
jgi:hypothetical protein